MKYTFLVICFLVVQKHTFAQIKEENSSFTCAEFKGGYGSSNLGIGLKEKFIAGHFSASGGWLASLAA